MKTWWQRNKHLFPVFFRVRKDGGAQSNVTGYWLIEWKPVFSITLLRFSAGSREAFHSHAFNAVSWVLRGELDELVWPVANRIPRRSSWRPFVTRRNCMHKVFGVAPTTWALSFRGPWLNRWHEVLPSGEHVTLTHGRKHVR